MNSLVKLTPLFLLLTFVSGVVCAADFSVPQSIYQQMPSSKYQLSEVAYRQFQPIQKQISAERYDEAFTSLNRLVKRHKNNLYVVSLAIKSAAYIYIAQQEYPQAIKWMQQVLKLSSMSTPELQSIRHDLSQLQLQAEQYKNAINTMEAWLQKATKSQISAADYQLIAVSHFQLKHYKKAKQAAKNGLKQPKPLVEPLYQLILACDFTLKNYTSADKILSILVNLNPSKKNYWIQWAGVLDLLDKPDKALVIFELIDQRQQLNEQEKIQFVQRLMQQGNAFKAANKLKEYIKKGDVIASFENQILLAHAWRHSSESGKAIEVLKEILNSQNNNDVLIQLAQIYIDEKKWKVLVELLERSLDAQVKEENQPLYLQLGYGYVQLKKAEQAKQTFRILAASKQSSKETKKSANQWLEYLNL